MKRIQKFALSLAMLLFFVSPILAQSPVKIYFMGTDGKEKLVSATDPLPVLGSFVISGEGMSTEATLQLILAEMTNPDTRTWILNWPGSYPVTGTFWQATQPVSGTFWQATQPVSGTFYQATQPVSITSMPSTPVTGAFWPDTQPISGAVSITGTVDTTSKDTNIYVTNMPSTMAVTGTFYQATQPVSIASMPSTPVTGSFYQTTQPVSIASMPSTPVTGTFYQATQPTSLADITLTDTITDTTMADTSTTYSVVLPAKCVAYEFQCKGAGTVDYAMSSGGVTTNYWTLKSGYPYNTFGLGSEKLYTGTIYFKCTSPTAGDVFQIRIWTKP